MTRKITKSNQSEQRSDRGAKRSDRGGAYSGAPALHPYGYNGPHYDTDSPTFHGHYLLKNNKGLRSLMLHTKFHQNLPSDSLKEDFKVFLLYLGIPGFTVMAF